MIYVKNAIDECLRIFLIYDDNMFNFFNKFFLNINYILFFDNNQHKLKILINIDVIKYVFIN